MSENAKTWLIESGDVLEVMTPNKQPPVTATVNQPRLSEPCPVPPTPTVEPVKRRAKAASPRKSSLHSAQLVALTYLLGPLAILLTPRGRREQSTLVLAAMSVMATVVLAVAGFNGLVRPEHSTSVWAWLGLLAIAVGAGFTAWARAVHLLAREGLPRVNQLPYWLRRKWSVSLLGLMAPGCGLLLGGHSGRAALTLWFLGPAAAAVVILLNVMGLWQHHLVSGWLAASGPALETAIMVATALAAVGFLGYIAQALQGVREVLVEPGLQTRVKGDYYALAVVAAVVVLVVAVNPVRMARQLDLGGDILQAEGFQAIPLQLTLAARHLDPGQPEYALQAVELYTALGRQEAAAVVRAELDQNLSTYVALVQKEAVAEYGLAQAEAVKRARPRPAVARAATEPVAEPGNLDQALLMGAMVGSGTAAAKPDTVRAVARGSLSRTLGMPFGPGLPLSEAPIQTSEPLGPAK